MKKDKKVEPDSDIWRKYEKKDFRDLNNAEIMKANLLKKITLNVLIKMNIEEKRNLGLKSTVGEAEIELFK